MAKKYPALDKTYNLRRRSEQFEIDYINKLSEDEKAWLNSFHEEYINANFNHTGKILHRTKKQRKACYDKNNSANRDQYTLAKAGGKLTYFSDLQTNKQEPEDMHQVLLKDVEDKKKKV